MYLCNLCGCHICYPVPTLPFSLHLLWPILESYHSIFQLWEGPFSLSRSSPLPAEAQSEFWCCVWKNECNHWGLSDWISWKDRQWWWTMLVQRQFQATHLPEVQKITVWARRSSWSLSSSGKFDCHIYVLTSQVSLTVTWNPSSLSIFDFHICVLTAQLSLTVTFMPLLLT